MKRKSQRQYAAEVVLRDLRREVDHRRNTVRIAPDGFCRTYRREILRLWLEALRAAERAAVVAVVEAARERA